MKRMADRMYRDERGSNKAGPVVVAALLLVVAVGVIEIGGARLGVSPPRVQNTGSVGARQQDSLRRSFAASRGAHQPSEQRGVVEQQRAWLSGDVQSSSGPGVWKVPQPSATATPTWGRQVGGLVFETLPEVLWDVLRELGEGVRRILG